MIKVGDKVICIKSKNFGPLNRLTYKKNKIYEVLRISELEWCILVNDEENVGVWFAIMDGIDYEYKFCDYFITLAELREQQIKSVIDG